AASGVLLEREDLVDGRAPPPPLELDAGLVADPREGGGAEPVRRRIERMERERFEGRDAGGHERAPLVPVDPRDEREVVGRDALALTAGAPLADLAELGGLRSAGKRVGAGRGFE